MTNLGALLIAGAILALAGAVAVPHFQSELPARR